ncbi:MAG: hypothetical protein QW177_09990 [Candidatus Nitrosotenuis sp.]
MKWFEGDIYRIMEWYNYKRPHMSLNLKNIDTVRGVPQEDASAWNNGY